MSQGADDLVDRLGAADILKLPVGHGATGAPMEQSLPQFHEHVRKMALSAIDWYVKARRTKKLCAQLVRSSAIILVGLAGLVPILEAADIIDARPPDLQIPDDADGSMIAAIVEQTFQVAEPFDPAHLGYIFAAVAAVLIGYDSFFGLSSGWIRYMTAELRLRRALADFDADWLILNAQTVTLPPQNNVLPRLQFLKNFSILISDIVEHETSEWAAEFSGSLSRLEAAATQMSTRTAQCLGTIEVTIERAPAVISEVSVWLDGIERERTSAQQVTLTGIPSGEHEIAVHGRTQADDPRATRQIVSVTMGGRSQVTMALPG